MLELNEHKILIDSLCDSSIPIYKNPPAPIKEAMITGIAPFNDIEVLLFTHQHSDHFDPVSTSFFLKNHVDTRVISSPEVIAKLNHQFPNIEPGRLMEQNLSWGGAGNFETKGLKIKSLAMRHDGLEYRDVLNLAYLIETAGKKILHVGDAKPISENYIHYGLNAESIDLLLAPFPYVGLFSARLVIEKYIQPKKVALVHLPIRELDHQGWIDSTMKNYWKVKNDFIETVFLEEPGDILVL